MNTITMIEAFSNLDDDLVEKHFKAKEALKVKKANKNRTMWIKWGSMAACFCLMIVITVVAVYQIQNEPGGFIDTPSEIIVGEGTKTSTGHNIGIKCLSFYREKAISIDTFMFQIQGNENEKINGYPIFEVFQVTDLHETIENGNLIINGMGSKYEKKFSLDDLKYLATNSIDFDVFDGHGETVTLDFSSFQLGDTVTVAFSYGVFYYKDNPYNQSQPDNSWAGKRTYLHFYIGENGVSVSDNSTEEAISNYEKYNKG